MPRASAVDDREFALWCFAIMSCVMIGNPLLILASAAISFGALAAVPSVTLTDMLAAHERRVLRQDGILAPARHAAPSTVVPYWDRDLNCLILSACSVLDINDYNGRYDPGEGHEDSPGLQWENVGPNVLLGYNYKAPSDKGGATAAMINEWIAARGTTGDADAWMNANASAHAVRP